MRPARLLMLGLAAAALGCGAPFDPSHEDDPARVAVELFELARSGEPGGEMLTRFFGDGLSDYQQADLLDALAALAGFPAPSVLERSPLAGPDEIYVDLATVLAGGGQARFAVKLDRQDEGWRVRWFHGPGVEWPAPRSPRSDGLTTSAPPPSGHR